MSGSAWRWWESAAAARRWPRPLPSGPTAAWPTCATSTAASCPRGPTAWREAGKGPRAALRAATSARRWTTSRSMPWSSPRPTIGTPWRRSGPARRARTCTSSRRWATTAGKAANWSRRRGSSERIVQTGHESRSAAYAQSAKKYLADGKLGAIHFCRVLDQKGQSNFPLKPDGNAAQGARLGHVERPRPGGPLQRQLPQQLARLVALFGRRHGGRGGPPVGPRPLALRPGASPLGLCRRGAVRQPRRQRDARHARGGLRVRQDGDELRADTLHALHAQGFAHRPQRRDLSLLAAMRHADRDLTAAKG